MKIYVRFEAQLRQAAGMDRMVVDSKEPASINELFTALSQQGGEELASRLIDDSGRPRRSLLVFVNEEPVALDRFAVAMLQENDTLAILPPIAGG